MKTTLRILGHLALAVLAAPVAAQESGWRGQVTPYVWASGVGGDITPFTGAPTFSADKSFLEVLEDLDAAFFLSGYARNGRFVAVGDLSHSSSSRSGTIPPGAPAEGRLRQSSATLAAGYRAIADPGLTLDVLAGARVWRVRGSFEALGGAIRRSPGKDFVDPILALRANVALAPRWSAIGYADIGGFGVGSRLTVQAVATANYQLSEAVYLSAGYRHLGVDYRDGGTRIDATMAGPLLGVTWRF